MDTETLKKIEIFSDLSTEEMNEFLKFCQMQSFPKGCIVIHQDDSGKDLYFILNGKVKVVITHEDGSEIILNTLSDGDYFGEMSGFTQMPRSATIITEKDSDFLTISQKAFADVINRNPKLIINMLKEMSMRLNEADELISSLSHLDAKGRVAKTLLKLSKGEGIISKEEPITFPRISLREIAAMSGTSRETVSRILSDFSKRGILDATKDDFIIHSVAEINKFAEISPAKATNIPKVLSLTFSDPRALKRAITSDLSKGGLFIKTNNPLQKGERFILDLQLPNLTDPIRIESEVEWTRKRSDNPSALPIGMGIRFLNNEENLENIVKDYIKKHL